MLFRVTTKNIFPKIAVWELSINQHSIMKNSFKIKVCFCTISIASPCNLTNFALSNLTTLKILTRCINSMSYTNMHRHKKEVLKNN